MTHHILPHNPGVDPFDLALALILNPASGEAVKLLGEHREGYDLFVVTESAVNRESVRQLEHVFVTHDDTSVRVTVQHEDEFPSSASCPQSLFDLVGPTRSAKAQMWRSVCQAQKDLKTRPEPGWTLRFDKAVQMDDGRQENEFVFDPVRGCRGACFVSTQTGERVAIPYFFDRSYEVTA